MVHYARRAPRGRPAMRLIDKGIEGGSYEPQPVDGYYATFHDEPLWPESFYPTLAEFRSRRYPPDIVKDHP